MERHLLHTVQDIIYLLSINGNTKAYQDKLKQLNEVEKLVLKKLKAQQANERYKLNTNLKQASYTISLDSTSNSSTTQLTTPYVDTSDDDTSASRVINNNYINEASNNNTNNNNDDDNNDDDNNNVIISEASNIIKPKKLNKSQRQKRKQNLNPISTFVTFA